MTASRRMSSWVHVVVLQAVIVTVFGATPYCTPSPSTTPKPSDPTFPLLTQTFQTRIEATITEKNYTASAEEYFDGPNNRASLTMYKMGSQFKLIFDYKDNQICYVYPGNACKCNNLTADDNNVLFGNTITGGKIHVFTSMGVLHFLQKTQTYMGTKVIRGIPCDHWSTCATWPQLNSTFTLDYYFSVQTWLNAAAWPQIPVRAEVTGQQTLGDGSIVPFHHFYDYVNFRKEIDVTSDVFLTPPGVVCVGRKQTRAVPKLQGAYIYREEIVAPINNAVTEADIWYDDLFKIVRYDFRPQQNTYPYFNTDAATEIHDFNTGIAYALDKTMGNCTIMPIKNNSFDASINVTTSLNGKPSFVLQMKSPGQLFYLDTSYTFEGQRLARDMVCDVFISRRNDFKLAGLTLNATFQFYFLAKTFTEKNNEGNIDHTATDIPIRLDIAVSGVPYNARYNIYDFSQEHPEISKFDISTCFTVDDKIPFKISFSGTFDDPVRVYRVIFLFQAIQMTSIASGASPLRIQHADFQMEGDQAFFVGTLLEKAPSISKFRKTAGMVLQYHNDRTIKYVSMASDCADYCTKANFTCNSFDYCTQSQVCTLSRSHTEDGSLVASGGSCDHYSRTLGGAFHPEEDLQTAWLNLKNAVLRGLFQLKIQFDTKTVPYVAQDITSSVTVGGARNPASTSTLKQFRALLNKFVPNYDDDIETGLSVDDCASACVSTETFICNSFEYQWATGYCYLSHFHPDDDPKKIKNNNGVDLYVRDYTSKFTELTGTTVLSSSPVIYQGIYDVNECAKLCVDFHEFPCKSFDYCDQIATCFVGKKHVLDVPKSGIKVSPNCNHYSRNYIDDFKHYKRKLMKLVNDRVITGVNLQQCAKACVDQETAGCSTFSYCGNYTECRLSGTSVSAAGQTTIQASAYCDIYSRQYYPNGQAYTGPTAAPAPSGYSGGSMAGLAIGMIILGLILAAVIVFAYLKSNNKTMDDMKIQFKRMDDGDS